MTHPMEDYLLGLLRPEEDHDIGPPPAELVSRLREIAIPLTTAVPGNGIDDLRPLHQVLEPARVVGLGEATHGTAEFFTLKHRLFELLVENLAFTTFALETGFAETLPTCDYVLGADNRDEAAAALPDTWSTPELVDLIEWMRARNATGRHPTLTLYGFDMQSPTAPVLQAMASAREVDPVLAAPLERDLAPLASSFGAGHHRATSSQARARARTALAKLIALLQVARETAVDPSLSQDLARAHVLARSAQRAEEYVFKPSQRGRDEAMAATVLDILDLDGADSKVALWAHNAHTQRGDLIELVGGGRVPTMGELLHRTLGPGYVRISFAFDRGSFRARHLLRGSTDVFTVAPAALFSLDGALAAAGHELAAFPLQALGGDMPATAWLSARPGARCISGATTDYLAERSYVRADPRISADVFVFVGRTRASIKSPPEPPGTAPPRGDDSRSQTDQSALSLRFALDETGRPREWTIAPSSHASLRAEVTDGRAGSVLSLSHEDAGGALATATHTVAVSGDGAKTAVVRAELSARVRGWPAGAHLTLRYDSTASIDEQLMNAPFALAPSVPYSASRWRRFEVSLALPADVSAIRVGLALVGGGTVRMRDLALEVS